MSPRVTWTTFVLAVLAILAAAFTSGPDREPRSERDATLLFSADGLPIDSVERITVKRRGEERLVFERSGGAWMQVEPFAHPMDAFAMRQLVTAAREVQVVDRLTSADLRDGLTAATLGLDPPEAVLTYEWGSQPVSIALGRRGIAGRAYARLDDDRDVLIISQELHERAVEVNPKEWRDRTLFRNVGIDCGRIVREDGATRLVLERDRRTWRMLEPVRTRVDREALDRFMQTLGGARAAGFIVDQTAPGRADFARFGLASGTASGAITVSCTHAEAVGDEITRTPHEQTLLIGNPAGAGTQDRFGMIEGRPSVVRVPAAAIQALFASPEMLIAPTGSGVVPADVKSIRIVSATGEVRLERDLEKWVAPSHEAREVARQKVQELLATLTELRAPQVLVQEYPQELEVAVITLFGFDARPIDTVRIVHHEDTGQWGMENGDNVLRVFSRGFQINLTPAEFGLPR